MSKLVVRPATREDIDQFSDMANKPTVKAWVGDLDGRIVGIGGVALFHGRWYGFIDLREDARPFKMTIARNAIRFLRNQRRDGIRFIYAEIDPKEPGAADWLASLGFHPDPLSDQYHRWSARNA